MNTDDEATALHGEFFALPADGTIITMEGATGIITVDARWVVAPPWPLTVRMGSDGPAVKLHADGRWEGDLEACRNALGELSGHDILSQMLLWMLLHQLERDDRKGFVA